MPYDGRKSTSFYNSITLFCTIKIWIKLHLPTSSMYHRDVYEWSAERHLWLSALWYLSISFFYIIGTQVPALPVHICVTLTMLPSLCASVSFFVKWVCWISLFIIPWRKRLHKYIRALINYSFLILPSEMPELKWHIHTC